MRILVAEDEFEQAALLAALGAPISRPREQLSDGRARATIVPLRGDGYVSAKPAS